MHNMIAGHRERTAASSTVKLNRVLWWESGQIGRCSEGEKTADAKPLFGVA